jgi:protein SCO1/2
VQLARYFDGERPVILSLGYHECPMLCNLMVQGLTRTLGEMAWAPGEEFEVLTVSFNRREGPEIARKKKNAAVANLGKPGAADGWHFLTGSDESIQRLTQAAGFHFNWIEEQQEFAHPSTVIFLSGERKITRYLQGVNPNVGDTRKALVEASDGQVGNVLDQIALRCFQYDPKSNSYVASAFNIMRLGSLLFAVFVGVGLLLFWRRESDDLEEAPQEEHGGAGESSWEGALKENT